jgi:hypothetical protein
MQAECSCYNDNVGVSESVFWPNLPYKGAYIVSKGYGTKLAWHREATCVLPHCCRVHPHP